MKITKQDLGIINDINNAIDGSSLLSISYIDAKKKPTVRTIEPYEIKNNLLYGHCRIKNATRAFSLNNIQSVETLEEKFKPRF